MTYTQAQIEKIEKNLANIDVESNFDEYIDETNEMVTILGMKYSPSTVLQDTDPTAYRCCLADYIDSEQSNGTLSDEINGEYYDKSEVDDLIESLESDEE